MHTQRCQGLTARRLRTRYLALAFSSPSEYAWNSRATQSDEPLARISANLRNISVSLALMYAFHPTLTQWTDDMEDGGCRKQLSLSYAEGRG